MMSNRDLAPDSIKGLCIILMVFGHINFIGSSKGLLAGAVDFIYTFHMPLFLIISGFYFKTSFNEKERIKNALRRIGVPYVLFISLYLIGLVLVKKIGIPTTSAPPATMGDFFIAVFFHPYGGYWFLHSLIILQVTILGSKLFNIRFFKGGELHGVYLTVALCVLLFFAVFHIIKIRTIVYFLIGIFLRGVFEDRFFFPVRLAVILFLCFLISIFLHGVDIYQGLSADEIVWCLVLLSMLWSGFSSSDGFLTKYFAHIGRNTLVVLVLHSFFVVAMKPLNTIFLRIDNSGLVQSMVVTFVAIYLCLLSARVFDLIGVSRLIFGVDKVYSNRDD